MRLYRVFAWNPDAALDEPGGALFTPNSSNGRFDNPDLYRGLYCAATPECAVGERFGYFSRWRNEMFVQASLQLAVATIDAPDIQLADLGLVATLETLGVARVIDVVTRDRNVSQPLGASVFRSGSAQGISWWSAFVADWTNVLVWDRSTLSLAGAPESLSAGHPAVVTAASTLPRSLVRN